MKRKLLKLLAASIVLMALQPAQAQMWQRQMQQQRADDERAPPPRQDEPQRDIEQRQEFRPPGHMSAEERRQLRRDIHEAGRELYRRNPRRGPPP